MDQLLTQGTQATELITRQVARQRRHTQPSFSPTEELYAQFCSCSAQVYHKQAKRVLAHALQLTFSGSGPLVLLHTCFGQLRFPVLLCLLGITPQLLLDHILILLGNFDTCPALMSDSILLSDESIQGCRQSLNRCVEWTPRDCCKKVVEEKELVCVTPADIMLLLAWSICISLMRNTSSLSTTSRFPISETSS